MRVGERGQVTIPKEIRDRFGLGPNSDVEFHVEGGNIVLKKAAKRLNLEKWRGRCHDEFGYSSVNEYMEDVRGR